MTTSQSQAVWELCRQGLHLSAYKAERSWQRGDTYHLEFHGKLPRGVISLIERCNREVRYHA